MSVSGILSSAVFGIGAHLFQNRMQKVQSEFQQLGQDLQSGNLTAAQSDFAALQQMHSQPSSSTSTQTINPIIQDFNQLAADLKAGNTTAARQDYTQLQKDLQTQPPTTHHHHQHSGGTAQPNTISQLFSQLGQALQSGNLSTAQQTYAALQQDFQQYAQTASSLAGASTLSVSA